MSHHLRKRKNEEGKRKDLWIPHPVNDRYMTMLDLWTYQLAFKSQIYHEQVVEQFKSGEPPAGEAEFIADQSWEPFVGRQLLRF